MPARIVIRFVLLLLTVAPAHGGFQSLTVSLTPILPVPRLPGTLPSVGDVLGLLCRVEGANSLAEVIWKRQPVDSYPRQIKPKIQEKYSLKEYTNKMEDQKYKLSIHNLTYSDVGIYSCIVTVDNKNISDTWPLVVEGKPEVIRNEEFQKGIIGNNEKSEVAFISRPVVTNVDWFGPTGNKLNESSPKYQMEKSLSSAHGLVTLTISNFSREDAGDYTLVLSNAKGVTTALIQFSAHPFVRLVTPSASTTFPYGKTAVFVCWASNFDQPPVFTWYHGKMEADLSSIPSTGGVTKKDTETSSTVTIRGITYDFIGRVMCVATANGVAYKANKTINVTGFPIVHSNMRTVRGGIGDTVKLVCNVTSNPPPTRMKWLFNKDILGLEEYSTEGLKRDIHQQMQHEVEVTSSADYGTYMCQVTNRYATIGYSINLVGISQMDPVWNCSSMTCEDNKVCDDKWGTCVCQPGLTENRDGTCTVTDLTPESKPVEGLVWVGVGAGSTTIVVTLFLGIVLYVCWKRRSSQIKKRMQTEELNIAKAAYTHAQYATANIYEVITRPSDEFPRERLRFQHPLGVGKFGRVMKAEALSINRTGSWEEVAVKMCQESATDLDKEDLYNELVIIRKIPKHINVVSFYGACTYGEPLFLILEYVPGGDLRNYLRRRRPDYDKNWESPNSEGESPLAMEIHTLGIEDGELTAKDLLSFALQSAKGMQHLESNNIVHRDVAARNVLIGYNGVCKISDFGLARDVEGVDVYERTSKGPLPIRWMSPESLMEGSHSHKADVWAFGILLWEIVTLGASPYSTLTLRSVIDAVVAGKRLERPQHCMDELYSLMCRCWEHFPKDRPVFSDLCRHLEFLLEKEADYIQLDQFQEAVYMVLDPDSVDEKL